MPTTAAPPTKKSVAFRGAEASIRRVDWWGLPALLKDREAKSYRPKSLDDRIRRERTRTEARLLVEARKLGVRTPMIYDIDASKNRLIIEELPGPTLKQLIEESGGAAASVSRSITLFGRSLGLLHAGGISHGDLTSSNVLYPAGPDSPPALIDLSMGERNAGVEELGIDLHLVEEDLKALHPHGAKLFQAFLVGYQDGNPAGAAAVRARAREIKGRVRYA